MGTFLAAKYQLMNKRSTNKKDAYTAPIQGIEAAFYNATAGPASA